MDTSHANLFFDSRFLYESTNLTIQNSFIYSHILINCNWFLKLVTTGWTSSSGRKKKLIPLKLLKIFKIWKLLLVGNCLTFVSFALVCKKWEINAAEKMQPKFWRFLSIHRKNVFQIWKCQGNMRLDGETKKHLWYLFKKPRTQFRFNLLRICR